MEVVDWKTVEGETVEKTALRVVEVVVVVVVEEMKLVVGVVVSR